MPSTRSKSVAKKQASPGEKPLINRKPKNQKSDTKKFTCSEEVPFINKKSKTQKSIAKKLTSSEEKPLINRKPKDQNFHQSSTPQCKPQNAIILKGKPKRIPFQEINLTDLTLSDRQKSPQNSKPIIKVTEKDTFDFTDDSDKENKNIVKKKKKSNKKHKNQDQALFTPCSPISVEIIKKKTKIVTKSQKRKIDFFDDSSNQSYLEKMFSLASEQILEDSKSSNSSILMSAKKVKPKQIRKPTTPAPIKTTTTTTPIVQISSPQKRSKSVNWDSNFSFDEKTDTKSSKESLPKTPKPILKKNQRRKSRSPYDVDYDEIEKFSLIVETVSR